VQASDIIELMTKPSHERSHLYGEDRGAECAHVAAALHPDRVISVSLCEILLSGFGLEESSYWTEDKISVQFRH
jgi:pimeloyl-ACP methyl ester carboxylesterase